MKKLNAILHQKFAYGFDFRADVELQVINDDLTMLIKSSNLALSSDIYSQSDMGKMTFHLYFEIDQEDYEFELDVEEKDLDKMKCQKDFEQLNISASSEIIPFFLYDDLNHQLKSSLKKEKKKKI